MESIDPDNAHAPDCLVIPDVHQNIGWVDSILNAESDSVERVVFLGDYFDRKLPTAANADETCHFLNQLETTYACSFTFLVGNHDLPYLFDLRHRKVATSRDNPYSNSVYSITKSKRIIDCLEPRFIQALEPFAFAHGALLSHAGLHLSFLPDDEGDKRHAVRTLYKTTKQALSKLSAHQCAALSAVGIARGGAQPHGGITWQDWFAEFEDNLPWPQIVGHTILENAEQKGRSWNLDSRAGHYAILKQGKIEVRHLPK